MWREMLNKRFRRDPSSSYFKAPEMTRLELLRKEGWRSKKGGIDGSIPYSAPYGTLRRAQSQK